MEQYYCWLLLLLVPAGNTHAHTHTVIGSLLNVSTRTCLCWVSLQDVIRECSVTAYFCMSVLSVSAHCVSVLGVTTHFCLSVLSVTTYFCESLLVLVHTIVWVCWCYYMLLCECVECYFTILLEKSGRNTSLNVTTKRKSLVWRHFEYSLSWTGGTDVG